mmetsp:Transcript_1991/g.4612  ORF Transcript_1991/g.4612 Transcript_1991/m.4612 type:complete len:312 (-) Transcript_1991:932-1867(-)
MPAGSYYSNRKYKRSPGALRRTRECCGSLLEILVAFFRLVYSFVCRTKVDYANLRDLEFGNVTIGNAANNRRNSGTSTTGGILGAVIGKITGRSSGAGVAGTAAGSAMGGSPTTSPVNPVPMDTPSLYQPRNLQAGFVPLHSFSSNVRNRTSNYMTRRQAGEAIAAPAGGRDSISMSSSTSAGSSLIVQPPAGPPPTAAGGLNMNNYNAGRSSGSSLPVVVGAGSPPSAPPAGGASSSSTLQALNPNNTPGKQQVDASLLPKSFAKRQVPRSPRGPSIASKSLIPQFQPRPPPVRKAPTADMLPPQQRGTR